MILSPCKFEEGSYICTVNYMLGKFVLCISQPNVIPNPGHFFSSMFTEPNKPFTAY